MKSNRKTVSIIYYSAPKFLDQSYSDFHPIHDACNSVYHQLQSSGVSTTVRHTSVIKEEEGKLWSLGVLGQGVCNALFSFTLGKILY